MSYTVNNLNDPSGYVQGLIFFVGRISNEDRMERALWRSGAEIKELTSSPGNLRPSAGYEDSFPWTPRDGSVFYRYNATSENLSARTLAGKSEEWVDANRELVGLGLAG